jgi:hypothetical protein
LKQQNHYVYNFDKKKNWITHQLIALTWKMDLPRPKMKSIEPWM